MATTNKEEHSTTPDNWRQLLLEADQSLTELHKNILLNGPKGLDQSWILGALKKRYQDEFS